MKGVAIHPEDEQLVAQLASLQDMHDQVRLPGRRKY
jgi:hypothetical protein